MRVLQHCFNIIGVIARQRVRPLAGPMTGSGGRSSIAERRETRAAHYIELLQGLDAPPPRRMPSAVVLTSAAAAQRPVPRTMVMKRT